MLSLLFTVYCVLNNSMILIGVLLTNGANWDLDTFGALFHRFSTEVARAGHLTRYVGYEGAAGNCVEARFFGVEVECIDRIPDGMSGLELGDDSLTVHKAGLETLVQPLSWIWRNQSHKGRLTGEFTAQPSPDSSPLKFRMTANAFYLPGKADFDDNVHLVPYDSVWPAQFEEKKQWLIDNLGSEIALHVEHYGSTAIPGMTAKPVIDILVEIPSFETARRVAIPLFNNPECEYWWYNNHLFFAIRKGIMGLRTHHIHLAPAGHEIWEGLAFRDYLIAHPEEAARYAALKKELAECHRTDRERYTIAKTAFAKEISGKATIIRDLKTPV